MEGGGVRSGDDRISLLPEDLMCNIVSFLRPKDAVRTSVLSSRWRNLWLKVSTLDLNVAHIRNYDACVSLIDMFHKYGSYLSTFKLTFDQDICGHNFSPLEPCLSRVLINQFSKLVCLRLSLVRLNGFESLEFPCLKIMNLSHVKFPSNDAATMLVPCSPVLEELVIRRALNTIAELDLRVCSKSLERLSLSLFYYADNKGGGTAAVIDAPRLKYLSLKASQHEIIRIINISPLATIGLDVLDFASTDDSCKFRERNSLYNLLTNVSSVGDMTISRETLMLIHHMRDFNPLPNFYDLSRLSVTMHSYEYQELLPFFLESCPNKETKLSRLLPCCLLSSFESVDIKSPITKKGTELKLVRYFLKNSATLKKLVLRLNQSYGEKQEFQQLLEYPRVN
ncbi:PREDICTED: F-box/FBD/LRR-repeat protein At5g18770-like [Camelina sativa]|uniref:F-box/FBD/LRR-repeat protein At5g18770-like n=1 Tax=Camelina sativa TaxID=90675 RepID=A0ABM0X5X1_CAMSA|nr:PREDICTED: F-box/FBD/LRR-repeat protein At5g18770-like [Camelina sativa]